MAHGLWGRNRQASKGSLKTRDRAGAIGKYARSAGRLQIRKEKPGVGFRHVLLQRDIERFIRMISRWDEMAEGLHTILLAAPRPSADGWHKPGVIAICAWPRDMAIEVGEAWFGEHAGLLRQLGVSTEKGDDGRVCHFNAETVRAYQLLHVLLHELGHHHDRMTTRRRRRCGRGEAFAESFAMETARAVWGRYCEEFRFVAASL